MWSAWEATAKAAETTRAGLTGTSGTAYVRPDLAWMGGFEHVVVPDNTAFVELFDKDVFADKVEGVIKNVVFHQDPAPGDYVPVGSSVKVTVYPKWLFPIDTFKGISEEVVDRFDAVGELIDQVEGSPAKAILGKDVEYADLSPGEKLTVDDFIATKVGVEAADEEVKSRLFSDIKFLYGF